MTNAMPWIKTSIEALLTMHADIGEEYKEEALKKSLGKRTTEYGECLSHRMQFISDYDACNPSDQNSQKCALFHPIKEDRVVANEFFFQKADRTSPINVHYVDLWYKNSKIKGKYACGGCFFKARMVSLLERIKHASIEVVLEISSCSCEQTFSLIGIRTKNENLITDKILAFDLYPKNQDGGSESKQMKTYLISYTKNSLDFLEIDCSDQRMYYINQTDTINSIESDFPSVKLIDINQIFFKNSQMDIISLYSEFKPSIVSSFNLVFQDWDTFQPHKEFLEKKKSSKVTTPAATPKKTTLRQKILSSLQNYSKKFTLSKTSKISIGVILTFFVIFIVRELTRKKTTKRSKVKIL